MIGVFVQVNEESPRGISDPIGYVIQESGCWDWVGSIDRAGYGRWGRNAKNDMAHRVLYERTKGVIPEGLHLDHLCRNRRCVNPSHLEPVTQAENNRRGQNPNQLAKNAGVCRRGHPYMPENNYITPKGKRYCLPCRIINDRKRRPRGGGLP